MASVQTYVDGQQTVDDNGQPVVKMNFEDMQVGKRYNLRIEDCCVIIDIPDLAFLGWMNEWPDEGEMPQLKDNYEMYDNAVFEGNVGVFTYPGNVQTTLKEVDT